MTKTKLQTLDIDYDVANGCVVITELNGLSEDQGSLLR